MSHSNFLILAFSNNFCPIKTDLSGNTVWPQASGFQKLAKTDQFLHFWLTFVHSKCKRSSLLSQCWMRLFLWISNTVCYVVLLEQHFYSSRFASCSRLIHLPRKATCQIKSTQSENKLPLFLLCSFFELLLCFEPHCIAAESSV